MWVLLSESQNTHHCTLPTQIWSGTAHFSQGDSAPLSTWLHFLLQRTLPLWDSTTVAQQPGRAGVPLHTLSHV